MSTPVLMTTRDLVDAVRIKLKSLNRNDSDYEAARVLDVSTPTMTGYRKHGAVMCDEAGLNAALFLNLEQEYVLFCLHFERAKDESSRSFWRRLAEKIYQRSNVAAISIITVFAVFSALPHIPQ